jgi:hypothetical protein
MLKVMTRTFRIRAAVLLAAVYALCVLAPAAAFAFATDPALAHCLTEGHVSVHEHGSTVHVHADGTSHHHQTAGDADHHQHDNGAGHQPDGTAAPAHQGDGDKVPVASCCGLFSVVAIADEFSPRLEFLFHTFLIVPVATDALSGRGPERISRPPIS